MAYIQSIIKTLENTFNVKIFNNIPNNIQIESVQILSDSTIKDISFINETLYIGKHKDINDIAHNGYILFLEYNSNVFCENGIYIYEPLDIFKVFNCIEKELFLSHKINLKKEELFHILHAGYGIQSILDTARTYLENTITLCTTSFSIIAASPRTHSDSKFEISSSTKKYLKKEFIQNMKDQKVLDHILNFHYPLITTFYDSPGIEFIFCSINIKNATVGYICVYSAIRPFTPEDSDFIVELCKIISIEMQKDYFYSDKYGMKYDYFLTDLIEKNFTTEEFVKKRMSQLGQRFYKYFWILGLSFITIPSNSINPKYFIEQIAGFFPDSMTFFYKGKLITLLTSKNSSPFEELDTDKFSQFLKFNQIYYAVSYRFENILDSWQYYNQVIFLLDDIPFSEKKFCLNYENNYLLHLIDCAKDNINYTTLIHPDILLLLEHDKINHTNYINTLTVFFKCNRSTLLTSKELLIHKTTLFYRLGKISDLTCFNINDSEILFAFEFSLKILSEPAHPNRRN